MPSPMMKVLGQKSFEYTKGKIAERTKNIR